MAGGEGTTPSSRIPTKHRTKCHLWDLIMPLPFGEILMYEIVFQHRNHVYVLNITHHLRLRYKMVNTSKLPIR